jgi:hypothetical protein
MHQTNDVKMKAKFESSRQVESRTCIEQIHTRKPHDVKHNPDAFGPGQSIPIQTNPDALDKDQPKA